MTYTITIPNADQPKTYAQKAAAVNFTNKQAHENGLALQVVDSETGNVVHVGNPVEGRYFHPFERLQTPPSSVPAPAFEGFVPAYHRVRVQATVFRGLDEFGMKGVWRIHDGRSNKFVDVANTKEANEVTKGMKSAQL